jgi:glycerate kinase
VASALAEGWRRARPDDELLLAPLADGGEGTLAAIEAAGGWQRRTARTETAIGRPIEAAWLASSDGTRAVVEMARASGLSLVPTEERDVLKAWTLGTGQLLRAVLDAGISDVILGIGGSATTDGGSGILVALGARLEAASDPTGDPAPALDLLFALERVDLSGLDPRLRATRLRIACDVSNPLLGPTGAAATYGPQKGADPEMVEVLDGMLADWADALEAATGRRERETPGAGAAGGVGFGLLCLRDRFASLDLEPGVELVMGATGFAEKLARADIVITGEGRIDAQTSFGKTALGVARKAATARVRCIAVGGGVEPEGAAALAAIGAMAVPVHELPIPVEEAIGLGAAPLVACGARLARAEAAT